MWCSSRVGKLLMDTASLCTSDPVKMLTTVYKPCCLSLGLVSLHAQEEGKGEEQEKEKETELRKCAAALVMHTATQCHGISAWNGGWCQYKHDRWKVAALSLILYP